MTSRTLFFYIGTDFKMLRSRSRLFLPLSRNRRTPFPHALGCLSAGNPLPAVRAVFDAVRF